MPIIGGTGDFLGVSGVLISSPLPQNEGVLFQQELVILRDGDEDENEDQDEDG